MRVVVSGRAGGKTHAALRWLAVDPEHRVMVVLHYREAERLLEQARELCPAISRQNFVGYREALGGTLRGRSVRLAVDNADVILRELFGDVEVMTASATVDTPRDLMEWPQ